MPKHWPFGRVVGGKRYYHYKDVMDCLQMRGLQPADEPTPQATEAPMQPRQLAPILAYLSPLPQPPHPPPIVVGAPALSPGPHLFNPPGHSHIVRNLLLQARQKGWLPPEMEAALKRLG
jgi:hypothetical protein